MGQKRNKTGTEFEKLICETNGWEHKTVSPRIHWCGTGRSNWDKMVGVDLDPTKFKPDLEKSRFEKYDAITKDGEKIEIKKYESELLNDWVMYSEPIFKIATRDILKKVVNIFGNGDEDKASFNYNNFLEKVVETIGDEIITKITETNSGIQCIDRFIPQCDLEYGWVVVTGWRNFNRMTIFVRKK